MIEREEGSAYRLSIGQGGGVETRGGASGGGREETVREEVHRDGVLG